MTTSFPLFSAAASFSSGTHPKKFFSRYIRSSMLGCGVMCLRVASTGRNISFFVGHTPNRLTQPKRSTPERTRIFLTLFFSSVAAFLLRIFPIRESIYLHLWLCLWRILMFVFFFASSPFLIHNSSSFSSGFSLDGLHCCVIYMWFFFEAPRQFIHRPSKLKSYVLYHHVYIVWSKLVHVRYLKFVVFFSLLRILFYPCESFSLTLQHTQLPDW